MSARPSSGRQALLSAAAHALAEHGYHGMTMRELARATHRSPATLYNYVDRKEDLLHLIQRDAFDELIAAAEAALAGVDEPREQLRRLVRCHVRFFADRQHLMRVLIHEAATLPPAQRAEIRARKERYFELARDVVAGVMAVEVQPAEVEVERATYCLFGMLNWTYGWYDAERHGAPDEVAAAMTRIALGGLGGAPPAPPRSAPRPRSTRARPRARAGGAE